MLAKGSAGGEIAGVDDVAAAVVGVSGGIREPS
jgi:hypothetical protein